MLDQFLWGHSSRDCDISCFILCCCLLTFFSKFDVILIDFGGSFLSLSHLITVLVECMQPVIVAKTWLHRKVVFSSVYQRFFTFF